MKNKGFTLIELLAVIVILAIIALIATPVILGIVNNAKSSANERSIELYIDAAQNSIADYLMVYYSSGLPDGEYSITEEGLCPGDTTQTADGLIHCNYGNGAIKVEVDNKKPESGKVWIFGEQVKYYSLVLDGEEFVKTTDSNCFTFDSSTQTIIGYKSECSKDVIIPSEIDSFKVLKIGSTAFESKKLTNVVIPEGIVEIGSAAFHNNNLTTVTIPSTVTTIGVNAFYMNSKLTQAVIKGKKEGDININAVFPVGCTIEWEL